MPPHENRFVDVRLTLTEADADRLGTLGGAYISPSYAVHLALQVFDAVYHGSKELYDAYLAYEVGRGLADADAGLASKYDADELFDELRRRVGQPVETIGERDLRSPRRSVGNET